MSKALDDRPYPKLDNFTMFLLEAEAWMEHFNGWGSNQELNYPVRQRALNKAAALRTLLQALEARNE